MFRCILILALLLSMPIMAQDVQRTHLRDAKHGVFDNDLLPAEFHAGRRQALRHLLPQGSLAVFFANPVRNRSNDVDFEYHQDPDFYYLSGLREPNSVLLVARDSFQVNGSWTNELLVLMDRDPAKELWNGHRMGVEGATDVLGVRQALTGLEFVRNGVDLGATDRVFVQRITENLATDPHDPAGLAQLMAHFEQVIQDAPEGAEEQLGRWMASLREIKLPEEIDLLRKAINITCEAQRTLMQQLEPDMTEYQTEA
ncbi:MAG: aminopeptidase P N-terminal domain-containing protein, partial [Flavobacteriales bacterium]|nr:aminopeptidase P N-terminal domain-containing protein [Flavobacteriales bacterium]